MPRKISIDTSRNTVIEVPMGSPSRRRRTLSEETPEKMVRKDLQRVFKEVFVAIWPDILDLLDDLLVSPEKVHNLHIVVSAMAFSFMSELEKKDIGRIIMKPIDKHDFSRIRKIVLMQCINRETDENTFMNARSKKSVFRILQTLKKCLMDIAEDQFMVIASSR